MKAWFFTEDAYPYLPDSDSYESIRVDLPNKHFDPEKGADLYHKYLDLWCQADELGLEIMNNEHHQTATCMVPAAPLMLAVLARETRRARLLILGNPLPNRVQPLRVAEEMAMIDVLSRGRLEVGYVRSVPYEAAAANIMPFRGSERLWEAHDLIMKAWTHHEGPFNWEGRFFHHRQVNIWPRPYQQPHPPVWVTTGSGPSTAPVARNKHVGAVFLAGYPGIRSIFDSYRENYLKFHRTHAPLDRLAYCALVYVGADADAARRGAEQLLWYMTSNKVPLHWRNPPGYFPPRFAAQVIRGGRTSGIQSFTAAQLDDQMRRGNVFAGTPDQVYEQIKRFYEFSGGFGHLLMMGQAGFLSFEDTVRSMKLFSNEVYPRLKELTAAHDPDEAAAISARTEAPDLGDARDPFGVEFHRKAS